MCDRFLTSTKNKQQHQKRWFIQNTNCYELVHYQLHVDFQMDVFSCEHWMMIEKIELLSYILNHFTPPVWWCNSHEDDLTREAEKKEKKSFPFFCTRCCHESASHIWIFSDISHSMKIIYFLSNVLVFLFHRKSFFKIKTTFSNYKINVHFHICYKGSKRVFLYHVRVQIKDIVGTMHIFGM